MAKAKAKTAADRKRVCGRWQPLDYKASDEEKAAYAEKQKATAAAASTKSDKKK